MNTTAFTSFVRLEHVMKEAATGQPQSMAELGNQWRFSFDTYVVLVETSFLLTKEEYAQLDVDLFLE